MIIVHVDLLVFVYALKFYFSIINLFSLATATDEIFFECTFLLVKKLYKTNNNLKSL